MAKEMEAGPPEALIQELRVLITDSRQRVARTVNSALVLRFAQVFPDPEIVTALRSQLSWTHLRSGRWLDRYERGAGESPPLGLILCADKNEEQIELLELSEGSVRVASDLTELPPRALLERRLLEAIERAQARDRILEPPPPDYFSGAGAQGLTLPDQRLRPPLLDAPRKGADPVGHPGR